MSVNSAYSKQSYKNVPSFSQHLFKEGSIDYRNYFRKVSKYDLDRGTVDMKKFRQEKVKDRTDNVKIKRTELIDQVE